jgi:hypothetical protein
VALPFKLSDVESEERFRNLSYDEQQRVRQNYINRVLMPSEEWGNTSLEERQNIINAIQYRAPVLAGGEESSERVMALSQRLRSGDSNRQVLDEREMRQVYFEQSLHENAGILGWIVKGILGAGGPEYTESEKLDRQKAFQYFDSVAREIDPKFTRRTDIGVSLGSIAADIILTRGAASLALRGARAAGGVIGQSAGWLDDIMRGYGSLPGRPLRGGAELVKQSGVAKWLLTTALPQSIESGLDATAMTLREALNARYAEQNYGVEATMDFGNVAKTFGQNFAMDWAMWGAIRVVGGTFRGFQTILSKAVNSPRKAGVLTNATGDTVQLIDDLVTGRFRSLENYASLPDDVKRAFVTNKGKQILANFDQTNPDSVMQATLLAKGYDLEQVAGGWRLTSLDDGKVIGNYRSTDAAARRVFDDWAKVNLPEARPIVGGETFKIQEIVEETITRKDGITATDFDDIFRRVIGSDTASFTPAEIENFVSSGLGKRAMGQIEIRPVSNTEYMEAAAKGRTSFVNNKRMRVFRVPDNPLSTEIPRGMVAENLINGVYKMNLTPAQAKRFDSLVMGLGTGDALQQSRSAFKVFDSWIKKIDPQAQLVMQNNGRVLMRFGEMTGEYPDTYSAMAALFTDNYQVIKKLGDPATVDEFLKYAYRTQGQDFRRVIDPETGQEIVEVVKYTSGVPKEDAMEIIGRATSFDELMKTRPDLAPMLPDTAMEGVSVIDFKRGASLTVEQQSRIVTGSLSDLSGIEASHFVYEKLDDLIPVASETRAAHKYMLDFNTTSRRYKVTLPDYGLVRMFDNLDTAKKWATNQYNDWVSLRSLAAMKGFEVRSIGSDLLMRKAGDQAFMTVNSIDDMKKIIMEAPGFHAAGKEYLEEFGPAIRGLLPDDMKKMIDATDSLEDASLHTDWDFVQKMEETLMTPKRRKPPRSSDISVGILGARWRKSSMRSESLAHIGSSMMVRRLGSISTPERSKRRVLRWIPSSIRFLSLAGSSFFPCWKWICPTPCR